MAELTVTVAVLDGAAVAMTVRPSDSSGASSPRCSDTSRRFLPRWFIPSVLFLSSPRLSLSISQPIFPCFFCVSQFRSSLSLPSRFLSLGFPPLSFSKQKYFQLSLSFLSLSSPFLSCTPSVFIGRGREGHPALPSHGRAWWQHGGGYCIAAPASAGYGPFGVRAWWCQ